MYSNKLIGLATVIVAATAACLAPLPGGSAQTPPVNGMRPADPRAHAIVDATVVTQPGPEGKIEHATIIIRDGLIEAVGPAADVKAPPDARVWSGEGMTVYPGLIEPALMVRPADAPRGGGAHWNTRVHPEVSMSEQPAPDAAVRKELRGMGFTAAAVYPSAGAFRGSGVVIALADEADHVLAYDDRTAMAMALEYGGFGGRGPAERPERPERAEPTAEPSRGYPSSLMGAIALLRQTLYDAQWHGQCMGVWRDHPDSNEAPKPADSLEALQDVVSGRQPVLCEVSDELNALRAAKIANEFKLSMILLGSGTEFRRLSEIVALGMPIIVPLEFPKRPDVSTQATADSVSLRDMMTWEQAPTNPRRLISAAGPQRVSLTTHKLKSRGEFHANLRIAIKHGLTEDQALTALTTTPAKLLGLDEVMGTIAPGKAANLVVVKGSLFDKEGKVHDTWVNGRRYEIHKDPEIQLAGKGTLSFELADGGELPIELDTTKSSVTITIPAPPAAADAAEDAEAPKETKVSAKKVIVQQDQLLFVVDGRPFDVDGYVRLGGVIEGTPPTTVTGTMALPDGSAAPFTITIAQKEEGAEDQPTTAPAGDAPTTAPAAADEPAAQEPDEKADRLSGAWSLTFDQAPEGMSVTMDLRPAPNGGLSGTVTVMGQPIEFSGGTFDPASGKVSFAFDGPRGRTEVEGTVAGDTVTGHVSSPSFESDFSGSREGASGRSREGGRRGRGGRGGDKEDAPFIPPPEELVYPLGEYGVPEPPKTQNILIKNATIWTSGPQGVIENGVLLAQGGKIAFVGSKAEWDRFVAMAKMSHDYKTIEAAPGTHITPGLIDCHSHTGISGGVNEGTQSNTAEVRIGDCIDPDDIDWYRQLAGGLVAANQLHGSANAIGGQNSVVKIKWGAPASEFSVKDAIPGIKFALGENVKRSGGRYPNTRMGVETFIRDAFTAAKEYQAKHERYESLPSDERAKTVPPRRDLELETLLEILNKQRIIHCHSYRQDEILMLIRVADAFGFTIGTFQHVLEGYKVADAIAKHGAGASSFSDWWAYKMEVIDAIPYNGSLMNKVGVLVSFNSDSDELARRMNTEAAKAVRYGGISEAEALKFVTINPAKQLRIDKRTGSLEAGKDADFAVWSGPPLSAYSKCEQTWIEGARYFDLESDKVHRETINRERQRIVQKILVQAHGEVPRPGEEAQSQPSSGPSAESQPETPGTMRIRPPEALYLTAAQREWLEEQARLGLDPDEIRPGECGCGRLHE